MSYVFEHFKQVFTLIALFLTRVICLRKTSVLAVTAVMLLPLNLFAGSTRIQVVAHIPEVPAEPQLLSATATASSQEVGQSSCCAASLAVDGNINSRWG